MFAIVNNALLFHGPLDPRLQTELEAEFADDALREMLAKHRAKHEGGVILFNRPANLLLMKLLLGVDRLEEGEFPLALVGELALHANDYIESPEEMWNGDPGLLGILAEFAPIWELNNPRHMFQLFVRTYLLVAEHLPQHENMVDLLRDQLGAAPPDLGIDGLPIEDYLALVFGFFTNVRDAVLKQKTCIIDVEQFFKVTTLSHDGIRKFLERRSGDLDVFRAELKLGIANAASFASYVTNGAKAMDAMVIKQRPILRRHDGRHSILDPVFLIELMSTTLYWTLFDSLDKKGRDLFSIYWGECFEALVLREMEFFYPKMANMLRTHVEIDEGEIDALVDFGDFVIVMEVKSGLLAKDPRLMRDPNRLRDELHKKFVDKKGVRQLVKDARAVVSGKVETIRKNFRIYPILVGDDPILQCFVANRYLDEQFQAKFSDRPANVAPLTVMLIDELEELLPYVSAGDVGWQEVLDARFEKDGVSPDSFHTNLASIRSKKKISFRRNEFLSDQGDRIGKLIFERYQFEEVKTG